MGTTFSRYLSRLRSCLAVIFVTLLYIVGSGAANAHPFGSSLVMVYLSPETDRYVLTLSMNIEAVMAEIDPIYDDTNDSPNAPEYDRLRALPGPELEAEFLEFVDEFIEGISLSFDGKPLELTYDKGIFREIGDLEEPRITRIDLAGDVPQDVETLTFRWNKDYGGATFRSVSERSRITHIEVLESGAETQSINLEDIKRRTRTEFAWDFVVIGYDHIIPKGLDHILFVVGIFLLSIKLRPILMQVTTFTIAHTVTLGLGALGIVNLPPSIVEPLIAASIVYVAIENILTDKLSKWRPALVFAFGLLHGLGFAGILTSFEVPPEDFILGLISFNVGVELGQLAVIAACFLAVGIWFGKKSWYRSVVVIPGSIAIAAVGAYWFIERVFL